MPQRFHLNSVQLGDQVRERVVVLDRKMPREALVEQCQIACGQQTNRDDALVHHLSLRVGRLPNGGRSRRCPLFRKCVDETMGTCPTGYQPSGWYKLLFGAANHRWDQSRRNRGT